MKMACKKQMVNMYPLRITPLRYSSMEGQLCIKPRANRGLSVWVYFNALRRIDGADKAVSSELEAYHYACVGTIAARHQPHSPRPIAVNV
ncbi:unnamed protein product [Nezara viridula]|uniref:Uncharacterized protein n=1 Tax=Nezara viridula TaxID=85310 RepID=A0A9P0HCJ1_NEZVI|nr:unnamed protein product [Nezara viridula]